MELGVTGGRLVVRISSKMNLSSLQDGTRVSLACPKEKGEPQTPTALYFQGPVGSWTPHFHYLETGGSDLSLTCRSI